jgi:hypothetical protein
MRLAAIASRTFLTLAALALLTTAAPAYPISYTTSAVFDNTEHDTDLYVGIMPAQESGPVTFESPGMLYLGHFMVMPVLNHDQPTTYTYNNDPFTITLTMSGLSKGPGTPADGVDVFQIKGAINGSLTGLDQSTLTATFNSITQVSGTSPLPFDLSQIHLPTSLPVASSGLNTGAGYGMTLIDATINTPEPASVALWGAVAALGLAAVRRTRRAAVPLRRRRRAGLAPA